MNSIKINNRKFPSIFIFVFGLVIYSFLDNNSIIGSILLIVSTFVLIILSFVESIHKKNIFCLLNIANLFLFFVFVIRAIQVLIYKDNLNLIYCFEMYQRTNDVRYSINEYPICKASFIGFIGTFVLNFICKIKDYSNVTQVNICNEQISYRKVILFLFFAIISLLIFLVKGSNIVDSDIHFYDIIWYFLVMYIICYIIFTKNDATPLVYLLVLISILCFALTAKRQYIVNILLSYIISIYYFNKKRTLSFLKIFLMLSILLIAVVIYGRIRNDNGDSFVQDILNEFCMYDMLVVSLKHYEVHNLGLQYGYNYLAIFTYIIPNVSIDSFDHNLTNIVFNGYMRGSVPITLVGSLYFNYSYFGIVIGTILLGLLINFFERRVNLYNNFELYGIYFILISFIYDLVRVGNIGREFWTALISFALFYIFISTCIDKERGIYFEFGKYLNYKKE